MTDSVAETIWDWRLNPHHVLDGLIVRDATGAVVGITRVRACPRPLGRSEVGFLDDMFVVPEARGTGAADALFTALRDHAERRGWTAIRWITQHFNERGRAFYDRYTGGPTDFIMYQWTPDHTVKPTSTKGEGRAMQNDSHRYASAGRNEPRIDAEEILEGILEWVRIESPSHDAEAVNRMVDRVESQMRPLTTRIERTPGRDGFGDILAVRSTWGGDGPGILVLSHLDTVHPIGTIDDLLTVRREGDRVYGPGIYDMKGGAYLAWYAFRHLVRTGRETPLPITFLFVPEEEVGSPTSRAAIEAAARASRYVLVTEPARDAGRIVTARKGLAMFEMKVTGRPSHAGGRHQDGRSAIEEMARQVLRLEDMTDYERGVTVSVGTISGGTQTNVVPAECRATIDLRVPSPEAAEEMCAKVLGLAPIGPDVEVEVTGGMNRPPYEKDASIAALLDHARALAADIGFDLRDVKAGGVSDGNFAAALGVPTLDGLGVDGHGAHSYDEHLLVSSLEPRTRLMLRLFETLE